MHAKFEVGEEKIDLNFDWKACYLQSKLCFSLVTYQMNDLFIKTIMYKQPMFEKKNSQF